MYVLHPPEGRRGKVTVAAHCGFLGKAEQKNGQYREVRADFEHSLDKNAYNVTRHKNWNPSVKFH
jgi:hypothetical protein